jgi:hypothetical protein
MTFEEALRAELDTITELTGKVFPLNATEGVKAPYVIYLSSEGIQDKTLQGYISSKEVDCEINILHDSYASVKSLTRSVLSKFLSFQGRIIGDNGPLIQNVTYEKPVELYESEVFLYRSVLDVKFRF